MSLRKKSIRLMAALGWQRTRGQKSKGQGILENRNSQAKTDIVVPIASKVPDPIRRTTIPRITVPRTAAQCSEPCLRIIFIPTTSVLVSPYNDGINTGKFEDINHIVLGTTDLVVTTTGNVNVCDSAMLRALKRNAVVCNIGHFDSEIDTAFMRKNWEWEEVKPQVHKVYRDKATNDHLIILSEGRLVNLGNATGHPSRIMDGSFANQVLAQMYLYERKFADLPAEQKAEHLYVRVLPKKLDEEVAKDMVEGFGGVITKLTAQQAEYIGVEAEGPFKPESYKY